MRILGGLLMVVGGLVGLGVYILTAYGLYVSGLAGLMLLGIFVPPADLVLSFIVSPGLGLLGLGAVAAFFVGGMAREAGPQ